MDDVLQVYDDFVVKHEAAYAGFRRIHESKNPLPVKAEISRDVVSLIIVLALTIVSVSSVIVSSSRTVDEFGGGFIGATAFVMIEGGIMAYAFFRARRTASKERLQKTVQWATAGLILTFIVALGANVDATLKHKGIVLPHEFSVVINLLVALSAPTLAFISSDVLAIELMATDIKKREADKDYEDAKKEWLDGLNRSWASSQKKWDVEIKVQKPLQIEPEIDVNLRKNTSIDRPSPKLKQAIEWLKEHPEHMETESRKLGELIGVSHATANKAQHYIKAEIDV